MTDISREEFNAVLQALEDKPDTRFDRFDAPQRRAHRRPS